MYMEKIKADQARKRNNMTFYLLQNTRNLQHMCTRSPILAVTLHTVLENGSTVPAGCSSKVRWCSLPRWEVLFIWHQIHTRMYMLGDFHHVYLPFLTSYVGFGGLILTVLNQFILQKYIESKMTLK